MFATKASPKEMLPIVNKPLIQYAVEEAVAAGITDMIFVTGRNKRSIEDHFDKAYELESELEHNSKHEMLELSAVRAGAGGEIQLTDGIAALLADEPVLAQTLQGTRYDCGSKLGYLKATIAYGMKHPEVGHEFGNHLQLLRA